MSNIPGICSFVLRLFYHPANSISMKKISLFLLACLLVLLLWNWSLIGYGVAQGIGQMRIVWGARPIAEVLEDPAFPDSLKDKLRIVHQVRAFAIDSLGLNDTENYTTVFDQKGNELMWVVTASEPFRLKAKTWHFPVVGEVPYKGYFDREKALAEVKALQDANWDVGLRNPGGWSTLGWFTDPILSGMLEKGEGDLASLIIHEMVHATIFVKDSVSFNENLATFIADSSAFAFLAWKYGKTSPAYNTYREEVIDHQRYSRHVLRGALALDSLYNGMDSEEPIEDRRKRKEQVIARIIETMDTLTLYRYKIPRERFRQKPPNNDYFLNYLRYESRQSDFKSELQNQYNGHWREMIRDYRRRFPFL